MRPDLSPIDFIKLLEDVPEGDWVAISPDGTKVLAHGPNPDEVREMAPEGLIVRKFTGNLIIQAT